MLQTCLLFMIKYLKLKGVMDLFDKLDDGDVVPAEVVDEDMIEMAKEAVDMDESKYAVDPVDYGDVFPDEMVAEEAVDIVDDGDVVLDEVVVEVVLKEMLEDEAWSIKGK
uniref:Uncharacterized protein n=1 Tax=Tanacetum cinerariifolium TaxID=118510 RepID=A0A6L2NP41_TANCI|nr:hypothetical protein [Tanacetum cinerariifolium]